VRGGGPEDRVDQGSSLSSPSPLFLFSSFPPPFSSSFLLLTFSSSSFTRDLSSPQALRSQAAWDRSKSKGDLGYYQGHQKTGGYKDGLKQEDFKMGAPRRLSEEERGEIDDVRRGAGEERGAAGSGLPEDPGRRVVKYAWEDSGGCARIYIDELPGYDSWSEAGVPKEGVTANCDDGESLVLLLASAGGTDRWYLHIPRLFGGVEKVSCVWKRNKLVVKIGKRVNEEWPSLDRRKDKEMTDGDREVFGF